MLHLLDSPYVNFYQAVSVRGPDLTDRSKVVVWSGKSQFSVPKEWIHGEITDETWKLGETAPKATYRDENGHWAHV